MLMLHLRCRMPCSFPSTWVIAISINRSRGGSFHAEETSHPPTAPSSDVRALLQKKTGREKKVRNKPDEPN